MEEKPFRPFRIRMSNDEVYDVPNHDAALVKRNVVEIGLDLDSNGIAENYRRCAILHIAGIEDIPSAQVA
ncbi:MAG TPA: hypothetical protein VN873_20090 [Candidatus Angelobacter sp.]|nr:hypothetical protein [Candidatus Angelobacter sp.]